MAFGNAYHFHIRIVSITAIQLPESHSLPRNIHNALQINHATRLWEMLCGLYEFIVNGYP